MAYVSLYRKWRPQKFADVVGQTHVVRTLGNALTEKRIAHAYLFTGPRGTGKTTIARLLAKGLNCAQGPTPEPCDECPACVRIAEGMAMDVVEIDGASNRGIDEMRDVRERVRFAPTEGSYKIYIIDEVHMLTNEAFNALLKVLEEPPAHVVFVFATTEPHKIPATVASRCQRFDFRRLSVAETVGRLEQVAEAENIDVTADALQLLARYAEGSLRDGLGILDQSRAYEEHVTAAVVADVLGVAPMEQVHAFADVLAEKDAAKGLALVRDVQEAGRDLRQFLQDVARYLRDVLLYRATGGEGLADELTAEEVEVRAAHAAAIPSPRLLRAIEALATAEGEMRWAAQSHLPVELAVVRLTADEAEADVTALAERVAELEAQVGRLLEALPGAPHAPAPAGQATAPAAQPSVVTPRPAAPASTEPVSTEPVSTETVPTAPAPTAPAPTAPAPTEPAPTEPAPTEPAPTGAPGDLAAVEAIWPQVHERLRRLREIQVQAFLREGRPAALSGTTLTIEFPSNRGFHRASLDNDESRTVLERVVGELLGRQVKIEMTLAAGRTGGGGRPNQAEGQAASHPRSSGREQRTSPPAATKVETRPRQPKAASGSGTRTDGEGAASDKAPNDADAPSDPRHHPAVAEALRIFGGEIIEES